MIMLESKASGPVVAKENRPLLWGRKWSMIGFHLEHIKV